MADVAPSLRGDRETVKWYAKLTRHWVAPGDAAELMRQLHETDILDVLPAIEVPTLCIARRYAEGTAEAEYVTSLIPDARLVVLEGGDRWSAAGDQDALVGAIRDFVGGGTLDVGDGAPGSRHTSPLRALLFTDIVDSSARVERLGDVAWAELLARHNTTVRDLISEADGHVVDTAGDGFFATFDGPARAVRCGRAIIDAVKLLGVEVRAGVHAGEIKFVEGKPGGIAVHVAARVSSLAGPSEVLLTSTVKDLVAGSHLSFEDAGAHELKGVSGDWHLYRLSGTSSSRGER